MGRIGVARDRRLIPRIIREPIRQRVEQRAIPRQREGNAEHALAPLAHANRSEGIEFADRERERWTRRFARTIVDRFSFDMPLIQGEDEIAAFHFIGKVADKLDVAVHLVVVGQAPLKQRLGDNVVDLERGAGQLEQLRPFIVAARDLEEIIGHVQFVVGACIFDDEFDRAQSAAHGREHKRIAVRAAVRERTSAATDERIVAGAAIEFDIIARRTAAAEHVRQASIERIVTLVAFGAKNAGVRVDEVIATAAGQPLDGLRPVSRIFA